MQKTIEDGASRIVRVELDGWKGEDRSIEIDGPTILRGPNGAGKTAVLDAIVWVLTGNTPKGRTNAAAAKFFPPRGGSVKLTDVAGRWIRRKLTVDHEKGTVSQPEPEYDSELSELSWRADDELLRVRDFLALSAEKKRSYILSRFAAASGDEHSGIVDQVRLALIRDVAGVAATLDTYTRTADLPDFDDERKPVRGIVELVDAERGIAEELAALVRPKKSTAQIFAALVDVAKERLSQWRRNAGDARGAKRELEAAAAESAWAQAAEPGAKRVLAVAEERYRLAREKIAAAEELETSLSERRSRAEVEDDIAKNREAIDALESTLAELDRLAEKTLPPPDLPAPATIEAVEPSSLTLKHERTEIEKRIEESEALAEGVAAAKETRDEAKARVERRLESTAQKAWELIGAIPDSAHELIPELRENLERLIEDHLYSLQTEREAVQQRYDDLFEAEEIRDAHVDKHGSLEELWAAERKLRERVTEAVRLEAEAEKIQSDHKAELDRLQAEHDKLAAAVKRRAEKRRTERDECVREIAKHESAIATLEEELARRDDDDGELEDRIAELRREAGDLEELRAKKGDAAAQLERIEEALGKHRSYEEACEALTAAELREAAWKATKRAIEGAREALVQRVKGPILARIGAFLESTGCTELPYLDLETSTGQPQYELGWISERGRIAFEALSGWQQTLLAAALVLAIAPETSGKRVLLVEAGEVSAENLPHLLAGLGGLGSELDACLVATWQSIEAEGWQVVEIGEEVALQPPRRLRAAADTWPAAETGDTR